jgi:hypothetical protein
MGKQWCLIALMAFFVVFANAKAPTNPVIMSAQQSPEESRRLYSILQNLLTEETDFNNMINSPRRIQL